MIPPNWDGFALQGTAKVWGVESEQLKAWKLVKDELEAEDL